MKIFQLHLKPFDHWILIAWCLYWGCFSTILGLILALMLLIANSGRHFTIIISLWVLWTGLINLWQFIRIPNQVYDQYQPMVEQAYNDLNYAYDDHLPDPNIVKHPVIPSVIIHNVNYNLIAFEVMIGSGIGFNIWYFFQISAWVLKAGLLLSNIYFMLVISGVISIQINYWYFKSRKKF